MSPLLGLYTKSASSGTFDIPFLCCLLFAELILGVVIIRYVPYTEIDWEAYMQEVEIWLNGEYDYRNIYGGTGPLVYPAGFLYLFAILRKWANYGTDIGAAQHIFLAMYLAMQCTVFLLFQKRIMDIRKEYTRQKRALQSPDELSFSHRIWSWRIGMSMLCLSKRVHSIFMLRLFNDGPTMLVLYISILLFTRHQWNAGCVIFSLAVSIKMNVLLFAPGLLLILLQVGPDLQTVAYRLIFGCALPQILLGAPFLLTYPVSYIRKAFELDRVFFYKWTVNLKFLPEDVFVSKPLSLILLACHVGGLLYFCVQWLKETKSKLGRRIFLQGRRLSAHYITYTLLVSNFVGIAFARTLHYQFYVSSTIESVDDVPDTRKLMNVLLSR